jgi:hypothetical protein
MSQANKGEAPQVKPKKGWKDHLLRSGVPLEYHVATVLTKEDMRVEADFSFLRRDITGAKEWSVDMAASWFCQAKKADAAIQLELLVECKYRSQEKSILFLPEPIGRDSLAVVGGTVSIYDHFTPFHIKIDPLINLEAPLRFVYKGIELHDGGAVEEDLRHGIQQLRYAAPARLRQDFEFAITMALEEGAVAIASAKIWSLTLQCGYSVKGPASTKSRLRLQ